MHSLIYVLDNQWVDKTAYKVTKELLEKGETVFIWPSVPYKDFNEMCIATNTSSVPVEFVLPNCHKGMRGLIEFSKIKCKQN